MTNLNHVVLIGNLTRTLGEDERSFGYVGNGQARANVSIAVNRSVKKGDTWVDEASYFDITIWGKTAENLKPYLIKGTQICVEGHLKQDRWEKDGQKLSRISIVADNVYLLGGKKEGSNSAAPHFTNEASNGNAPAEEGFNPTEGFPEDIPF